MPLMRALRACSRWPASPPIGRCASPRRPARWASGSPFAPWTDGPTSPRRPRWAMQPAGYGALAVLQAPRPPSRSLHHSGLR